VLLDAGRGGASAEGLGASLVVTNSTPVEFQGGSEAVTNTFETGETSGSILINYDFHSLPDEMRVYYETNLLYDSGLVSFSGSTNINYGPGSATSFTVVMNEGGNSESNTAWLYTVGSTRIEPLYLTFTENTNLTVTPIKFGAPPFTNLTAVPNGLSSDLGIFYLPEESLDSLIGKSAYGQWRLEMWDIRAGATNPPPRVLSWQLSLLLNNPRPTPISLAAGTPSTNLLGSGQIQWYEIDAPDWVSFVTNSLLSSSAPVNLLFNPSSPPTGTNVGDVMLGSGATVGTWVLRTNSAPGFNPGSRYYLGIQNTNSSTVTFAFTIDFDVANVITLAAGQPYANTNLGPLNSTDFYRYIVSTNAVRAQFEINGPTGDVTLMARKGPPLPSLASYDFVSANPGTNDEWIVVHNFSRPVHLSSGEWFLAVVNVTGAPAAYSVLATEFPTDGTNILVSDPIITSDSVCLTWSTLPGVRYFLQGKSSVATGDWLTLSPTLTASDYTTTFCIPLPTQLQYFRVSEGLVLVPALPIISTVVNADSGILLQWTAPTNFQFNLQWTASLAPADWHSFSNVVSSVNGSFSFFDTGSQTGGLGSRRFYRLRQLP
jgi:hypothetical protein